MKSPARLFIFHPHSVWFYLCCGILLLSGAPRCSGSESVKNDALLHSRPDVRQAMDLRDRGNYTEAARAFEHCLRKPVSTSARPGEVPAGRETLPLLYWAATCYLKSDSPPGAYYPGTALCLFIEMQESAERAGDIPALLRALHGQARCGVYNGDYTGALRILHSCEQRGLRYVQEAMKQQGGGEPALSLCRAVTILMQAHMFRLRLLYDRGMYDKVTESAEDPAWKELHGFLCTIISAQLHRSAEDKEESISEELLLLDSMRTASLYEGSIFITAGMACRDTGKYEHSCRYLSLAGDSLKASPAEHVVRQARSLVKNSMQLSVPPAVMLPTPPMQELQEMCSLQEEQQRRKILIAIEYARTLVEEGNFREAARFIHEQERRVQGIPGKRGYFQAWFSLLRAQALCTSGTPGEALMVTSRSAEEYALMPLPDIDFISSLHMTEGEISEILGRNDEALSHFEHAFDTMSLYHDAGAYLVTQKRRYNVLQRSGQGLIRLYRAAGRHEEAFGLGERIRNATLNVLWGEQADLFYTCDQDFMRARGHVSLLKERCDELVLNPALTGADDCKKLNSAVREGLAMARNLQAAMPGSFATLVNSSALPAHEIQNLLDRDTALLAYYYEKVPPRRSPGLMLRVVTSQASRDYELPLQGSDMEKQVTVLNQRVLTHSHLWNEHGAELYRECIAPARQLLEGKTKLVIVPDGIMSSLPFSLLLDSRGRSLEDSFEITYAPSAGTWSTMQAFSFSGRALAVKDMQKTPGITAEEAIPLSCFTRDGCAELKVSMPPGTICRLSAPCRVDGRMPSLSGLYGRHGEVTRYDFFSLPAGGVLIMADECTTSLNGLYHGSELPAFTGPFFQAGASAVLFTLWPPPPAVRDEAFSCFLRELERSGSPGGALKAMQAAMRKKYPLPINWAPYVLYGK